MIRSCQGNDSRKRNEKLLIDRPTYLYNMKTNFNAFIIPGKKQD